MIFGRCVLVADSDAGAGFVDDDDDDANGGCTRSISGLVMASNKNDNRKKRVNKILKRRKFFFLHIYVHIHKHKHNYGVIGRMKETICSAHDRTYDDNNNCIVFQSETIPAESTK